MKDIKTEDIKIEDIIKKIGFNPREKIQHMDVDLSAKEKEVLKFIWKGIIEDHGGRS